MENLLLHLKNMSYKDVRTFWNHRPLEVDVNLEGYLLFCHFKDDQ